MKDYPISLLCRIAGVSKSGYYKWWKNADKVKDEFDILLIAEMFFKSKQKAGFRTIKMKLLTEYGIIMNHKKIIRIMKKYGMTTKIRQANPYKLAARIRQDNIICPNLVNIISVMNSSVRMYYQIICRIFSYSGIYCINYKSHLKIIG